MKSDTLIFIRIFGVSWLVLFCEIMSVRWLGMEIRVLRAFPNLVVIIALVATSAGLLVPPVKDRGNKKDVLSGVIAFFILMISVIFSVPLGLADSSIKTDHPAPEVVLSAVALLVVSGCLYILFKLLGKLLAAEFDKLKPIVAYSSNLLGSIAGGLTFMIISMLSVPPYFWLAFVGCVALLLYRRLYIFGITVICVVASVFIYSGVDFSPYSKITIKPAPESVRAVNGRDSFLLYSNNLFFNAGLSVDKVDRLSEIQDDNSDVTGMKIYFKQMRVPLTFQSVHDDVLVLGSGPGNDVAYALKCGAKHVDAVEIDPVIVKVGREKHPDHPLIDSRVTVFIEDAREFLRYSKKQYDLIEFAFLDPGNTVDSASLVRVDNFVYTVESIKSVLNHLKPNGLATLWFGASSTDSFINQRLYKTIEVATGKPPIAYTHKDGLGILLLFGPGAHSLPSTLANSADLLVYPPAGMIMNEPVMTDDWPFLYLALQPFGLLIYALLLFVAVVVPVLLMVFSKADAKISKPDWGVMFFLGLGFMLMETKSITQLSLLFGATWLVSSVVILFVLVFAFGANTLASTRDFKSIGWLYAGLVLSLAFGYFWQMPTAGTEHPWLGAFITCAVACLPVFFGSFIFSICFKRATSNIAFLSANLIGVAIGGLTENICMFSGIKFLGILALFIYGLAYVCWKIGQKKNSSVAVEKAPEANVS
jgi:SAM-dependent methyltransferase